MDESAELRKRLDPLYAGPPEEFIAGRDALAKELKAEKEADASKAVRKLRRPSVAAALVNRVALGHAKEMKAFAEAVADLRGAGGRSLRDAAKAQRQAVAELTEIAEGEGGEGATLDRFAETLQAAAADDEIEDLVVRGRLEKEQRAASIGFGLDVSDDDEPAEKPAKAEKKAKGKAKAEAKEAEPKQTAAERKREQAAAKRLEQARKREQRKVDKAKKALEAAVTEQQQAEDEVEAAKEALAEAKQDLADAKEAADEAHEATAEAKQELRDRERELADLD